MVACRDKFNIKIDKKVILKKKPYLKVRENITEFPIEISYRFQALWNIENRNDEKQINNYDGGRSRDTEHKWK